MVIRNILIDFGDGVLWFVKILFILYVIFYLFSLVYCRSQKIGMLFLLSAVIIATVSEASWVAEFKSISIPYFALGIVMSVYKTTEVRAIVLASVFLICFVVCGFACYETSIAVHSAINALLLATFIIVFSIKQWQIRFPAILGVMSFDLYIIHNKVLQSMKCNMDVAPLWMFVIITFVVTYLFYMLRTKVFKI